MKKSICSIIISTIIAIGSVVPAYSVGVDRSNVVMQNAGNVDYVNHVTDEMCTSEFWKNKLGEDANRVLMTTEEITKLNSAMLLKEETFMNDLENMKENYNAKPVCEEIPANEFYINGEKIDNKKYFGKICNAILETGYRGNKKTQYAVITARADMKAWPTKDILGYSPDDTDDELQSSSMNINEPFVIMQHCIIDGEEFYMGYSTNCSGWIPAECAAICTSKDEWLDAWKVDATKKDFLVVTQDKIILETSTYVPEISDVKLHLGTILKLVKGKKGAKTVGERSSFNNYVVYIPTRDKNGKYVKKQALISQHYNVSVGYRPLTQGNILDTAFTCLGNRYGWGGMLDSMDCSAYVRYVYRCFGLELPRNTTWQTQIPDHVKDISKMSDSNKMKYIKSIPAGSLLMFNGHITLYLGTEKDRAYVISDTGSLSDSSGEVSVISAMSVIVNPLDVRRADGSTWLSNMIYAVTFGKKSFR